MAILVTAFEAFNESVINSSQLIADALSANPDFKYQNHVHASILPTQYGLAGDEIVRLIREIKPRAVLSLGMQEEDNSIRIEQIAKNWDSCNVPDNVGTVRLGQAIVEGAANSYDSTLPINRIVSLMKQLPVNVRISLDAGNYVCNHVFFRACHEINQSGQNVPCGLIHVPPASGYSDVPDISLPLETMVHAIALCVSTLFPIDQVSQEFDN